MITVINFISFFLQTFHPCSIPILILKINNAKSYFALHYTL